jgi:hypothetical protein
MSVKITSPLRASSIRPERGSSVLRELGTSVGFRQRALTIGWVGYRGLKFAAVVADGTDMDISAVALAGLEQAQAQLESAASSLVGSADLSSSDSVDLSAGVAALMSAKNNFAVNACVMKTADETQKHAIDLIV